MRNLKVPNALPRRALVLDTSIIRQWKVVGGNSQATLWQNGTGATITTGISEQQENAVKTNIDRSSSRSNNSARKSVRLNRHASTNSKGQAFDIADARAYCSVLLRKYDSAAFTLQTFIPAPARDAYLALRAFNIEIARVPDVTSNPTIGAMRLQFWRDAIRRALNSDNLKSRKDNEGANTIRASANAEPVAILLASAVADLRACAQPTSSPSMDFSSHKRDLTGAWYPWLNRIITAREQYLNKRPYPTLDALETYAEDTYSVLMYLCLSSLPVASVEVDHVASHIGKAVGISTVLRGLPFLAFPSRSAGPAPWPVASPQSSTSSPSSSFPSSSPLSSSSSSPTQRSNIREQKNNTNHPPNSPNAHQNQGTIPIPLDVLASTNVREEDVFRCGSSAPNLRDAVFNVASRAHEHLITAHEMLESIRSNRSFGASSVSSPSSTDTENTTGSSDSDSDSAPNSNSNSNSNSEIDNAFGVLMQAIPTRLWLEKLQRVDFDIFDPRLRRQDWRLPWKAYWAFKSRKLMD